MSAEKLLTDIQQQHEVTQVLKALLEDDKLMFEAWRKGASRLDSIVEYRALLKQRLFGGGDVNYALTCLKWLWDLLRGRV